MSMTMTMTMNMRNDGMRHVLRCAVFAAVFIASTSVPLAAQADTTRRNPWEFYHGCWSTSSNGAIGPMICVVPDSTPQRVEMLSVVNDVIVSRVKIDADGVARPFVRGTCLGYERANWSPDSLRLYMQAEYRCRKGADKRLTSASVMAPTRADAFTRVERTTSDNAARPVVMNFIVQLDTTFFPAEVKRRITSYRALSTTPEELEVGSIISDSAIAEAARVLDVGVVDAWLQDRGQPTYVDRLRVMGGRANDKMPPVWPRGAYFASREGGLVAWNGASRQFLADGLGSGLQTIWNSGYADGRSFYDGNTSWLTSQYMATTAARSWR